MNRKSGFTLMELLLVVAVLAIVAAAAAPTFFGGARDAMIEARKSRIASAFTTLFSQANMAAAVAQAKGEAVVPGTTANWPVTTVLVLPHPVNTTNTVTLTLGWSTATGVTITPTSTGTMPATGLTSGVITDLEKFLNGAWGS